MTPEGMVHALQKLHRLLATDGLLIDIHPTAQPPALEVRRAGGIDLAGWIHETDDYIEYEQADAALSQTIDAGLFELESHATFEFLTHAYALAELQDHLAREWKDARIDEQTAGRVEELMLAAGVDRELIVREVIQISRLRARSDR
jgi:hypothetical protein